MHLIMVSRRLLGAEQCWVVRWTLIETWLYYITGTDHSSHALADAVKSDVAHLVTVCRAFLLPRCRVEQPLGAEQIFHTKWQAEIFAHSCIRGQTYINSPLWTSPPAAIIDSCHILRQSKAFCFVQPIMVCGCGVLGGRNSTGLS